MHKDLLIMKRGSFYWKLLICFIIIVIVSTSAIGTFSLLYFQRKFNDKLCEINSNMLTNIKIEIDKNVLLKTENIYNSIIDNDYLYSDVIHMLNHFARDNSRAIINSVFSLRNLVKNDCDLIDSIYIYSGKNNMVISTEGFSFFENTTYLKGLDTEWYEIYNNSEYQKFWTDRRLKSNKISDKRIEEGNILTFVRAYPFTYSSANISGIIAINIKESYIQNILNLYNSIENNCIFIINENKNIISYNSKGLFNDVISTEPNAPKLKESLSNDNFNEIHKINGRSYHIKRLQLISHGWQIVSCIPHEDFYNESIKIIYVIILLCAVTVLIGLIISFALASNIYAPLSRTLVNAKKISSKSKVYEKNKDEILIINNIINHLTFQLESLETTLNKNLPLIKHGIIDRILHGYANINDWKEQLSLPVNSTPEELYYLVLILELDKDILSLLGVTNGTLIKYSIIEYVESLSNKNSNFIAIDLYSHDDNKIAVLCSSINKLNRVYIDNICVSILEYIKNNLKIVPTISASDCTSDSRYLNDIFNKTLRTIEFSFFLPDIRIIHTIDFQSRISSVSIIPEDVILNLIPALNYNNIEAIEKVLNSIVLLIQRGDYSIEQCNNAIKKIIDCILQYAKDVDIDNYTKIRNCIQDSISNSKNIYNTASIIRNMVSALFSCNEQKKQNKNEDRIQKVQSYIQNNIFSDISLQVLSDMMCITPQYLCKLFKEYTGTNYQDYLTNAKMVEASRLIKETSMQICEISQKLGYNNPSYFIRKFREVFGQTPKDFRETEQHKKLNLEIY